MDMNKVNKVVNKQNELIGYSFHCPGCTCGHIFYIQHPNNKLAWKFNGNPEKPTFSPSLLNQWQENGINKVCHLFVRDGNIIFCSDSTHTLAGKTIPLPVDI